MTARKILLLPGTSNPEGTEGNKAAYGLITKAATDEKLILERARYPGWGTCPGERLEFSKALGEALRVCREFEPDWLIARSLGCDVAVGVLGSGEAWVKTCAGAVLWGPSTSGDLNRVWPSRKERAATIERWARECQTLVTADFFESIPPLENCIGKAACNLRLARGALDGDNTAEGVDLLKRLHQQNQPTFRTDAVLAIPGLRHSVTGTEAPDSVERYLACLFEPIRG